MPYRRIPYTVRPQKAVTERDINRNHPLLDGCIAWWLFDEGAGGSVRDLMGNYPGTLAGTTTPIWVADGLNNEQDGTNARVDLGQITNTDALSGVPSGALSVFTKFTFGNAFNSGFPRFIDKSNGGGAANGWLLELDTSGNDIIFQTSGITARAGYGGTQLLGETHTFGFSAESGDIDIFLGGGILESFTGTFTFPGTATNAAVTNWNHATDRDGSGTIHTMMVWDRKITEDEYLELYLNPYIVIERRVWVPGATLAGAPQGAIAANLPTDYIVVADLRGDGLTDSALSTSYNVVAELRGQSELASAAPVIFDLVADLRAAGQMGADAVAALEITGDLRASGQLNTALEAVVALTADLSSLGAGEVQALLPAIFDVAADLRAQGDLDAALGLVFSVGADADAAGQLDAALDVVYSVLADMESIDSVAGALPVEFTIAAALLAEGNVGAALDTVYNVAADLRANGQLGTSLAVALQVAADLQDAPGLQSSLPIVFNAFAALTNSTPQPSLPRMADPSSTRPYRKPKSPPVRRMHLRADRWNQLVETYDAFLRRQEMIAASKVSATRTVEQATSEVKQDAEHQSSVTDLRNYILDQLEENKRHDDAVVQAVIADTEAAIEQDIEEIVFLARNKRDEEDILQLIAMLVKTNLLS